MFDLEIYLLNEAYKQYNLNNTCDIEQKILDYIEIRLKEEEKALTSLLSLTEEKITYDKLYDVFKKEKNKRMLYEAENNLGKTESNYVFGTYTTSLGNIAIETTDTLSVLEYLIKGIKSRNTMTFVDLQYNEFGVKSALINLFSEALAKFGLNTNLFMYVPYEECFYNNFDEVIYITEDDKSKIRKKEIEKYYLFLEDIKFVDIVQKEEEALKRFGKNYEIINGNLKEAVTKINQDKPFFASIFTSNRKNAFEFINLVHAKNVFVNVSFIEAENIKEVTSEIYVKKKIAYPLDDAINDITAIEKLPEPEKDEEDDEAMTTYKVPWYKDVFDLIKSFFEN